MGQMLSGCGILLFGLLVGGVGLASAGIGIGIPMIPLGIYLIVRGFRAMMHDDAARRQNQYVQQTPFEMTRFGGILFGILLVLIGLGTSACLIGIPLLLFGGWLVYYNIFKRP